MCIWAAEGGEQLGEVGALATPPPDVQPQAMQTKGALFATIKKSSSASHAASRSSHQCFYDRAICAVAFSSDSRWLVAIGQDNRHRIGLWDWKGGTLLAEGTARNGTPPQIHDVVWRGPGQRRWSVV